MTATCDEPVQGQRCPLPHRHNGAHVMQVKCCRVWPVVAESGWRRCGRCGTRPMPL